MENKKSTIDILLLIEEAIKDRVVLSLVYRSADNGNRSERYIEPLALYFTQDRWMMIAYCRLRKNWRAFRLDAIVEIENTLDVFPPNQFELSDYFEKK